MGFWFLKQRAKEKLRGIYPKTILGQLICYIPAYILSSIVMIMTINAKSGIPVLLLSLIGEILVIDIFTVGYIRSLLDANERSETDEKRYDINLVLSGFSKNYGNTLKTMFLRRLYLFGWGGLIFLPIIATVGVIAFFSKIPTIANVMHLIKQFMLSPTSDMALNIYAYISENCMYIIFMFIVAVVATIALFIPYIRKTYSYEMIPMIVAENPDISSEEAFAKTRGIMQGYRWKYFLLQLSFIGVMILASIAAAFIPVSIAMYIALAAVMPYMNMTFIQFYLARTRIKTEEAESATE